MSIDLPDDIWRYIAELVPVHILMHLYAVNPVFYQIAFDLRYAEVRLFQCDKATLRLLDRLQDPFVAERVRILRVRVGFVHELTKPALPLLHGFIDQLVRLKEFHLVYYDDTAQPFLLNLLRTARSLRKLKLECSTAALETLLRPNITLTGLEDVSIVLSGIGNELSTQTAQWINNSALSLRSLTLAASQPIDCEPFFNALDSFPNLTSLTLSIPSDKPHLGSPLALQSFLITHSSRIQTLTLDIQDSSLDLEESHWGLEEWLNTAIQDLALPSLTSLTIDTKRYPFQKLLESFSSTLRTLDISGVYIPPQDLESLLSDILTPDLRKLTMGPIRLYPEIIDLLVTKAPGLVQLVLKIGDVVPTKDSIPLVQPTVGLRRANRRISMVQVVGQIDEFEAEMRKREYPTWKNLRHIEVWKVEVNSGKKMPVLEYQARLVKLLEGCVPGLRPPRRKERKNQSFFIPFDLPFFEVTNDEQRGIVAHRGRPRKTLVDD